MLNTLNSEKMKYCVSLDWLQVYCLGEVLPSNVVKIRDSKYRAALQGYETTQFTKLFYIYRGDHKVAEIQQCPRTSVINKKATILKLDNRLLYSCQYMTILYEIIQAYNLYYKGITRIDIALDCQELAGGLQVQDFFRRCVGLRQDEQGFIYNVGRSHTTFVTCRDGNFGQRINSVRWGSSASEIGCYAYDKTLELIEKKDKPWIREYWTRNDLDYCYNEDELFAMSDKKKRRLITKMGLADYVKKPVYRFEISIKGKGKAIVNQATGELFTLSLDEVANSVLIRNLFFAYARSCFRFRENTGQKNERYFSPLEIFENVETPIIKPYRISEKMDTGKGEIAAYNKLAKMYNSLEDIEDDTRYHILKTMELMRECADLKTSLYQSKKYYTAIEQQYEYRRRIDIIDATLMLHRAADAKIQDYYSSVFAEDDAPTLEEIEALHNDVAFQQAFLRSVIETNYI